MEQVFISYAHKDRELILPIFDALEKAGLTIWNPASMPFGSSLIEQAKQALEAARCVVVIWSEAAKQSRFAQQEMHWAIQAWSSDRLVLAKLDNTPLPLGLSDLEAISLPGAENTGTNRLIERVVSIVAPYSGLASPPEPFSDLPGMASASLRAKNRPKPPARHYGLTFAVGLVGILAVTIGIGMFIHTWYPAPAPAIILPFPSAPAPAPTLPSPFWDALTTGVILGAIIGAVAVWGWATWSRARSNASPSQPPQMLLQESQGASSNAPHVFVSYSHQDARTVDQLVKQIERLGFAVWIDRESAGAQRYAAEIVRAIRMSKLVALMCSQNAFSSNHVIREVYVAGDYKKPFIAFLLDPTEFPDELLYFLSGFPRLPISSIDQQKLRAAIAGLVAT